jgi:hypothetical protein
VRKYKSFQEALHENRRKQDSMKYLKSIEQKIVLLLFFCQGAFKEGMPSK